MIFAQVASAFGRPRVRFFSRKEGWFCAFIATKTRRPFLRPGRQDAGAMSRASREGKIPDFPPRRSGGSGELLRRATQRLGLRSARAQSPVRAALTRVRYRRGQCLPRSRFKLRALPGIKLLGMRTGCSNHRRQHLGDGNERNVDRHHIGGLRNLIPKKVPRVGLDLCDARILHQSARPSAAASRPPRQTRRAPCCSRQSVKPCRGGRADVEAGFAMSTRDSEIFERAGKLESSAAGTYFADAQRCQLRCATLR